MDSSMLVLHSGVLHRGPVPVHATKGVELPKPHGHSGDGLRCLRCLRCLPAVMALGAFGRKKRRPQAKYFTNKNSCGKNQSKMTIRAIRGSEWLAGEQDDREFDSKETYLKSLADQDALPIGFQLGSSSLKFVPEEAQEMGELPMKLTVICLDEATDKVAAVFTQNAFPGAPVKLGRRRMAEGQKIQAIVVNNKISNVSPPDADGGVSASETICSELANNLKLSSKNAVLPSSTGVIGWRLPVKEMIAALPKDCAKDLSDKNALEAAEGIMTTDRYPKLCSRKLSSGRLVGIAKGAGMIEPNMATMLCFLMTDVDIPREELQEMLSEIAVDSFNAISVDGDESTSDTVILLSSGKAGKISKDEFKSALRELCCDLSAQIVRNGEGTQHVIRVTVTGAESDATARRVGKAVVNGPLFKSAIAGNDPNVGRLIGKVGQTLGASGAAMAEGCTCKIGGETIFENGQFRLDTEKERRLSGHLKFAAANCELPYPEHRRVVDVEVILGGGGSGSAVVLGSDLTTEYVKINADYRS